MKIFDVGIGKNERADRGLPSAKFPYEKVESEFVKQPRENFMRRKWGTPCIYSSLLISYSYISPFSRL